MTWAIYRPGGIAERAERGVDIIKIMASGGNMTPGSRADLPRYGPAKLHEPRAGPLPCTR